MPLKGCASSYYWCVYLKQESVARYFFSWNTAYSRLGYFDAILKTLAENRLENTETKHYTGAFLLKETRGENRSWPERLKKKVLIFPFAGLVRLFCEYLCNRSTVWPRSGELRTQRLKSHLVRTQSLNVLPLKPGVTQYIAIHATLTARDFFLAYFDTSGPFTCIFSQPLLIFPCVGCG